MSNRVPASAHNASLYALALGDAWGDSNEFQRFSALTASDPRGPEFPRFPRITDDTQMSFAAYDAITDAVSVDGDFSVEGIGAAFAHRFGAWSVDRDNNRAPGSTCMSACRALRGTARVSHGVRTVQGQEFSVPAHDRRFSDGESWDQAGLCSLGCGTVMRAPWIGVHPLISDNLQALALIAQISAATTHTHPGAIAAAEATAVLARLLAVGSVVPGMISPSGVAGGAAGWLARYADAAGQGSLGWLDGSPVIPRFVRREESLVEFTADGWSRIAAAAVDATRIAERLREDPWGFDPCEVTNHGACSTSYGAEGWDGVSCLALAVGILDSGMEPVEQLRRATVTNGDSDSIAATLGGLLGAAYGESALFASVPEVWVSALENRYLRALDVRAAFVMTGQAPEPVFD